jgi:uncharacterized delta-60 repeat protein
MRRRVAPPAAFVFAAAVAAGALVAGPARAGSLVVRDTDGSQWAAVEDPVEESSDYLLKRIGADGRSDPGFGRAGQSTFTISPQNDAPASVRVDATHRIWMVGASIAGNQPQPVIERFLPNGSIDLRWGVQGKVQLSPGGLAVQPNDLLPLSDGSVLVAGETSGSTSPKAVVFHLRPDGSLDLSFGNAGLWQRAGDADTSSATSLAASGDGVAAVSVAVRGAKPAAELWSLNDAPPKLILHKPLDDSTDGADLRTAWSTDHWALNTAVGPTGIVPPASLANHPAAPAPASVAYAASDPGEGGFNPFAADPASAPAAPGATDDGLPWTSIGLAAALAAVVGGALFARGRGKRTVIKASPRR